jgi:hypothetical protein
VDSFVTAFGALIIAILMTIGFRRKRVPACEVHSNDRDLVKAEDVAWWNSLSALDWQKICKHMSGANGRAIASCRNTEGLTVWEANIVVQKTMCQFYGWIAERPSNMELGGDVDARLPYAVWKRVNESLGSGPLSAEILKGASSANAYVRQLIRSGEI